MLEIWNADPDDLTDDTGLCAPSERIVIFLAELWKSEGPMLAVHHQADKGSVPRRTTGEQPAEPADEQPAEAAEEQSAKADEEQPAEVEEEQSAKAEEAEAEEEQSAEAEEEQSAKAAEGQPVETAEGRPDGIEASNKEDYETSVTKLKVTELRCLCVAKGTSSAVEHGTSVGLAVAHGTCSDSHALLLRASSMALRCKMMHMWPCIVSSLMHV